MSTDHSDDHGRNVPASYELIRQNARYRERLRAYTEAFGEANPHDTARELARLRDEHKALTAKLEEAEGQVAQLAEFVDGVIDDEGAFRPEFVEQVVGETGEEHRRKLEEVVAERDRYKAELESNPDEYRKQANELKAQIRLRDHRDAWSKAVGPDLAEGVDIDTFWNVIGYRPDADEVDASKIAEQAAGFREKRPFLFKPPPSREDAAMPPGGANGVTKPPKPEARPLTSGLPGGRGAPDTSSGLLRVTRRDLADPEFMRANQQAIAEASRAGTLQFAD